MKTIDTTNPLTPELKQAIDSLSVFTLLKEVRYAPAGDSRFFGEAGVYRLKRLRELQQIDPQAYVRASKLLTP